MSLVEQLQPLLEPAAVSVWPLAIGWWLSAALIPLLLYGLYKLKALLTRKTPQEQPLDPVREAALAELFELAKPYDGAPAALWLQQLNSLLKRLCRMHYPDANSHTLSGRAWLAFLDTRCPAAGLTRWMILVEGAYKGQCQMTDKAIIELEQAIAIWIRKHV